MLKNDMIQMLNDNRGHIKQSFGIVDNDIDNIKEFLNNVHGNFNMIIDDMSKSNLSDRGKMALCCVIGYVNSIRARIA